MPLDTVKALRSENKRLQSLVARLTTKNETMSAQLKEQEDALAKRRGEVAVLHQACAKYKRLLHQPPAATKAKKCNTSTTSVSSNQHPNGSSTRVKRARESTVICLRCPQTDEKLSAALADNERLQSVLVEKEATIATLTERDRVWEERRAHNKRTLDEWSARMLKKQKATLLEMDEMSARNRRIFAEREEQQERLVQERLLVIRRRRGGMADGG